jgi:hypothetical protein
LSQSGTRFLAIFRVCLILISLLQDLICFEMKKWKNENSGRFKKEKYTHAYFFSCEMERGAYGCCCEWSGGHSTHGLCKRHRNTKL